MHTHAPSTPPVQVQAPTQTPSQETHNAKHSPQYQQRATNTSNHNASFEQNWESCWDKNKVKERGLRNRPMTAVPSPKAVAPESLGHPGRCKSPTRGEHAVQTPETPNTTPRHHIREGGRGSTSLQHEGQERLQKKIVHTRAEAQAIHVCLKSAEAVIFSHRTSIHGRESLIPSQQTKPNMHIN